MNKNYWNANEIQQTLISLLLVVSQKRTRIYRKQNIFNKNHDNSQSYDFI